MMVKSVTLPLAPVAAFALFTQRIGEWWPPDRRHTQDPTSEIFLLASGRFYERARDGREVDLGRVRSWDPPRRILLDFFIATGPEQPTEVEITIDALEGGARVTVVHRPKPESEALGQSGLPVMSDPGRLYWPPCLMRRRSALVFRNLYVTIAVEQRRRSRSGLT